jgi:molybdopterin biosynthesis enzyme MoaB
MKRISLFIISLITISASAQTTVKQDAGIKQMVDEVSAKTLKPLYANW